MQLTIIAALVLPVLFYIGASWGTAGVAVAWLVGHSALVMPLYLARVLRITGLSLSEYARSLWPAVSATLLMATVVLCVEFASPPSWPAGARLATQVLIGAAAYSAVLFGAHRGRIRAFRELLRQIRG